LPRYPARGLEHADRSPAPGPQRLAGHDLRDDPEPPLRPRDQLPHDRDSGRPGHADAGLREFGRHGVDAGDDGPAAQLLRPHSSRAVYLGSLAVPESSVITQQPGTTTDTIIAPQACVTWRHPVPVRGRGKQGRTNMPGPHHLAYDEATGKLNVGGITEYTTAWNTYQTNLANAVAAAGGNPFNLIVLDRKLGTYNTPGTTFIDPQVNTHRRWELRLSRHR